MKRVFKLWEHEGWGNSMFFLTWEKREITGHISPIRPEVGDEIQSRMASGKVARFKVASVNLCSDPSDMFFATVEDVGYLEADT